MLPTVDELKATLESCLSGLALTIESAVLLVPLDQLINVCKHLRAHEPFVLDYLANLTAVDYPQDAAAPGGAGPHIAVVYHLYSMAK